MVEKEQIVSAYRSYKGTFEDEIEDLNKALREMEINCEVISKSDDDRETLIFKKVDL
jgi:hypothetical protein